MTTSVEPGEIYAVTFVVELPFDLGVRGSVGGLFFEERGAQWAGWPDEAVRAVTQLPDEYALPSDLAPGTRWMFRRGYAHSTPPLYVADHVFGDWVEPLLTRRAARARRRVLRKMKRGIDLPVTVVALTRFLGPDEVPEGPEDEARLVPLYAAVRSDLNRMLSLIGLALGRWWIAPVGDRELSAVVPVITELAGPHEVEPGQPLTRRGRTFPFFLHDRVENLTDDELVSQDDLALVEYLIAEYNRGGLAFLPVFQLLHEASGDLNSGRNHGVIVLTGAAVELFVTLLFQVGGPLREWDEPRIQRALSAPFRNRLENHLPPLLGLPGIDLDGEGSWGDWWRTGYQARNRFVHEALAPSPAEATEAWLSTNAVIEAVRESARDSPLAPLVDHMPFQLVDPKALRREKLG